ncbi:MAG: phosphate/phosphite/phosphonate ABC transporter substrate-binding protein [Bdellovibrionales bacterium]|nr:phosphate/phosphite/phosphonate ABC transporter substrate-binding protein [Bdellovibrionales bacterium]
MKRLSTLLTIALLSACTGKPKENVVKMGFTPAESTDKVSANGKVLADMLEKSTGLKFQVYVASDYTALVEAMKSNQVQIGWLAPFAFVLAEQKAGAHVLLKSVRHGKASQFSALIVRENSGLNKLEDLKGKTIAWTDPTSSSGHILPKSVLIAKGIDPDTFFKRQTFAGSHETAVLSVMNGTVDVAATFSDDQEGSGGSWTKYTQNMAKGGPKLKAVFVTPPMPSDTVSVSKAFFEADPTRVDKIRDAIQALTQTPEGLKALKDLYGIEGLVPAKSEEYAPLRQAAEKLGYNIGAGK